MLLKTLRVIEIYRFLLAIYFLKIIPYLHKDFKPPGRASRGSISSVLLFLPIMTKIFVKCKTKSILMLIEPKIINLYARFQL
jgi:hypothetical protein